MEVLSAPYFSEDQLAPAELKCGRSWNVELVLIAPPRPSAQTRAIPASSKCVYLNKVK